MSPYIFEVTIKASNIIVKNWLVSKAIFKLNKSFSSFTLSSATSSLSSLFAFLNFCSLFVMILEKVNARNSLDNSFPIELLREIQSGSKKKKIGMGKERGEEETPSLPSPSQLSRRTCANLNEISELKSNNSISHIFRVTITNNNNIKKRGKK